VLETLQELLVVAGREQPVEVLLVLDLDPDDPALAVGVLVQQIGRLAEGLIDGGDDAGDRGVDVRDRLDGLD
jgi:hypothetical protein